MKSILIILSVSLATSFSAMALDVKQRFDHLDSNKDGYLTHNELEPQPQLLSNFKRWDKNQDNKISLSEFKRFLTNNLD
ncbi:EF-hand domain-containing protein [Pseudoalteromonas sp. SR44-5]|uniref:EF-hand domain-containing protein n=1 Tax=Pseudoalteromonas TaxID=53246 RepID=UPI0012315889|nr:MULTISPECIES: EF-hand domain-containing protein [Pseudoalteromonas]MBB1308678.1 EF-hand domain-containing protein [Pseudoalteromonas sp. SR41-8]MBB1331674.1 EF-hand domain-containing protein [Pseudoalteromonas sp. SR41-6]MBB1341658.1 EF-hand domain-containing protein [Pseudoalteromonas sp. SR45-6]MBB1365064.1 EF-hand domain-containing protein [Pseudoalteromonas sp. SR44-5]MBB1416528.1 EF-hand domain-containing protein [Pseudoalteromonas sp. SG44-1]|tara:strand:+ start:552 stop:788 length:237 start_codon:yes stop_codon:yes gene_type:complete